MFLTINCLQFIDIMLFRSLIPINFFKKKIKKNLKFLFSLTFFYISLTKIEIPQLSPPKNSGLLAELWWVCQLNLPVSHNETSKTTPATTPHFKDPIVLLSSPGIVLKQNKNRVKTALTRPRRRQGRIQDFWKGVSYV